MCGFVIMAHRYTYYFCNDICTNLLCATIVSADMSTLQTWSLLGRSLPIQQNSILLKASHTSSPSTLWYPVVQDADAYSTFHESCPELRGRLSHSNSGSEPNEPLERTMTPCDVSAIRKIDKIILPSEPPKQPISSSHQGSLFHALNPVFLEHCTGGKCTICWSLHTFSNNLWVSFTENGRFGQDSPLNSMLSVYQASATELVLWVIAPTLEGHWQSGLFLPGSILLFGNYLECHFQERIMLSTLLILLAFYCFFFLKA